MPNCACPGLLTVDAAATGPSRSASKRARARPAHRSVRTIDSRAAATSDGMRQTLVEHHRDVGTELSLDVGRLFRRQQVRRPVEVRSEVRSLLVDGAPRREAEHLIAAAVGEDRPRPADEAVEPAAPRDQVVAGTQIEMIGVAEEHLGAEPLEIPVRHPLTAPCVPTGMNAGVSTAPCGGRHHAAARAPVGVRQRKSKGGMKENSLQSLERNALYRGGRGGRRGSVLNTLSFVPGCTGCSFDRGEACP